MTGTSVGHKRAGCQDSSIILLFDIAIVVFVLRASPEEVDPVAPAPEVDGFVDKLAASVGMDTLQSHGKRGNSLVRGLYHPV
jgi:hypothetical protein